MMLEGMNERLQLVHEFVSQHGHLPICLRKRRKKYKIGGGVENAAYSAEDRQSLNSGGKRETPHTKSCLDDEENR
jgi:hypothetical protein